MNRCPGCGRLRGLFGLLQCPCWTSVNSGATVPHRLRGFQKRISACLGLPEGPGKDSIVLAIEHDLRKAV